MFPPDGQKHSEHLPAWRELVVHTHEVVLIPNTANRCDG